MKSQVGSYVLLNANSLQDPNSSSYRQRPVSVSLCLHHSYVSINADSRCCIGMQVIMEGVQAVWRACKRWRCVGGVEGIQVVWKTWRCCGRHANRMEGFWMVSRVQKV